MKRTKPDTKRHKKGRPPKRAFEVMALFDNGSWKPDDGKKHIAFSCKLPGTCRAGRTDHDHSWPVAIAADCACVWSEGCPGRLASHETCRRFGASNGHGWTADGLR